MTHIDSEFFGTTSGGDRVDRYHLTNERGTKLSILTYGGTVQSICLPDKNGQPRDIVLGCDTIGDYEQQRFYFGALIGRHANRIASGRFRLNGKDYSLACNDGKNHLHGGNIGFDKKIWQARSNGESLVLSYLSPDGEEGYPGNLTVKVTYTLSDDNLFAIDYEASADQDTVCNLTNHTYFNLGGHDSGSVLDQKIQIFAGHYTEADPESLPNGRILPVDNTPFDLRRLTRIGNHISDDFTQLRYAGGFDHNWVLNGKNGEWTPVAFACDETTGITLTTGTTLPGLQFYSGNYLTEGIPGKNGTPIQKRSGFCLETQYFPNAFEHPSFPQPVLKKGDLWRARTTYAFGLLD